MIRFLRRVPATISGIALGSMLLAGCAQIQPSNIYMLTSMAPAQTESDAQSADAPVVGVGPVTIAAYLDRPQIVTRASPHRLELAEFDRWAESLPDLFTRMTAENLSALLGSDRVYVLPRRRTTMLDYQVEIDVSRFDADSQGKVVLIARWSLYGQGGREPLGDRQSVITGGPVSPRNYEALAAVMSEAIAALSEEIADSIRGRPSA